MSLRMVTSLMKGSDSHQLGVQIAQDAQSKLGGKAGFALLYASSHYDHRKLLTAIHQELKGVPLIGCTTGGEFTNTEIAKNSVVLALFSDCPEYKFHVALEKGLHNDPMACIQKIADQLPPMSKTHPFRSAILLHDGLAGRGEEAVLSASMILGPNVDFAGGAAGDDLAFEKTFVFCNDEIATDAATLCMIDTKTPVSVSVKHGHSPITETLTVTKAEDNILYEVDGEPAWELWTRLLREPAKKININVDELNNASDVGAFLVRYELGLTTADGYKVRVPLSKNDDGSLNFACTIPEGAKFRIMESPKEDQIASAREAAEMAKTQMNHHTIGAALVFDCVCRAIILGDEFEKGIDGISKTIGKEVPLVGFETYGEICRCCGKSSGFHNTTTVVMLLPAE